MPSSTIGITTPLGNTLAISTFSGREEISRLFHFQLGLVAPNGAQVPFESIIGQPVTVRVGSRYFSGIVQRFGQGKRGLNVTNYTAEVVPWLWFLTRSQQSRIFQQKSVPDILAQVFSGFPVDFRVQGTFQPRDYCVQYRETAFNFVSRLMEEEGIYYYFKHESSGHTMVVANSPAGHTQLSAPISYDPTGAARTDAGVIYRWEKGQELRSGLYTLRDHCFELPDDNLEVQAQIQESVLAGSVTHHLHVAGNDGYEIYDYPGGYAGRFDLTPPTVVLADGARTAGIRMEEEALPSLQVNGGSNTVRLTPGYMFTFDHHFDGNGDWLITSVDHTVRATTPNGPVAFTNSFRCIPAALPFRPARTTPRPTISGVQTAIVVGPTGEEIWTDQYGRVKVQFFWDREGKMDDKSSCWIRVAHPTMSPGLQASIPRIGQEVVVDFLEGDPDQPIIVGTVDNTVRQP